MRSTMNTSKILLLAACLGTAAGAHAQDAQLSQFDAAPILLNPALTGMYEGSDFRMSSNLRSQWNSIGNTFLTTGFAYDALVNERYGAGAYISNYDMAGLMNTFEFGITSSYNVSEANAEHTLSVGLRAGIIYKKISEPELLFDQQYNDGYFDPDLPSGEQFQRGARLMPELGLGVAYRSKSDRRRVNPFANFAAFHVTTPDESILRTAKHELPIRWSFMGGCEIEVNDIVMLKPMGLYWRQGADQQVNVGLLGLVSVGGSAYSVIGGVSHRLNDAVIAHAGLRHKNNMYRFSYDVTTSELRSYTNNNGAFEFSIVYFATHSGREARRRVQSKSF